jgi:hypothetical protein
VKERGLEEEVVMTTKRAKRAFVVGVTTVALTLMGAGAAIGIVYGEPDGTDHPFVGTMVIHIDGMYFQWCSGTLVEGVDGDDVFLTAAHCVADLDVVIPEVFEVPFEEADILVTFDPEIMGGAGTYFEGEIHWHPSFATHGLADLFDVAVIVFDGNIGINDYGTLPEAGLLDEMKQSGQLRDQTFTTVGYGTVRETRKGAFASILDNLVRHQAEQEFLSLTKAWITMSMNEATGNAGTCYGDSGGPHFIEEGDTHTIVSLTVTGDTVCKATDKTYRLDTESARSFLADFVLLP